jgi:outer membrane protein OmpA-like peptidoglycan-associated protein
MLFFYASFSQKDTVYWSGKVCDKSSGLPVKNAWVHLKLSNGGMYEAISNDSGYYFFALKTTFESGELSIATDKNTTTISKKSNGFIASKDKLNFTFPDGRHITYNFLLNSSPVCFLYNMPGFWFKENSTEMVAYKDPFGTDSAMSPAQVFEFYDEFLKSNPEIVIELRGRCDESEKNKQALSEKRAQLIADSLIARGIPIARLVANGIGAPPVIRVTEADLVPKTEEQKKFIHQQWRSVSLRIINWDYLDPNAPKKAPRIVDQEENDEDIIEN